MSGPAGIALLAAALVVLADSWRRASLGNVSPAEERVFRRFNDGPDVVHIPVWAVMQAGSYAAVYVVTAMLWIRGDHAKTAAVFVLGTVVWLGVKSVKRYIGRGRPDAHLDAVAVRGQVQTGLGYPSGHSALSMTLALAATQGASPGLQLAAVAVAVFTGCARMYVGAHLPLDVAGGFAIGVIVGQGAVWGLAL
ncbi:MAG: hypothetical protein DHS20C19_10510 [Acidimicrobiales bacterium]|nr:MAG: hypothetical protein DHS20C19_10510 [Acidimicrobiales bacterium]